jgi:Acyl-protein synthetase, LuxE
VTVDAPSREIAGLLVASRLWAERQPVDDERVRAARASLLLANHARYAATVPVYRRLLDDLGVDDVADGSTLAADLLISVDLFKSYDDTWLADADFAAMTRWLSEVSTQAPEPELQGVRTVAEWRNRLRGEGIYLGISSGSSGRLSFVPRDRATAGALATNGRAYSPLLWGGYASGKPDYDLLLLTLPGRAIGMQAVATGLASQAGRSHLLTPPNPGEGPTPGGGPAGGAASGRDDGEAFTTTLEFLRATAAARRRLLIFGGPPAVAWFCSELEQRGAAPALPPDTLLVTGGGWKGARADDRASSSLAALDVLVAQVMRISSERWVDVYGMSECNAYLLRCPAGRYHVPPVLDMFVVDDNLTPLPGADATGTIGLLDPFAFSYPGFLLTGDRGRLVTAPCPCGLAGSGFIGEITRAPQQELKGCAGALSRLP